MRKYYIAAVLIVLFGLASFGLYYATSKDVIADQQAAADIQQLQSEVNSYANRNKKLPDRLNDLDLSQQKVAARLGDYAYQPLGITEEPPKYSYNKGVHYYTYEICADFKTVKEESTQNTSDVIEYFSNSSGHHKGRNCFKLKTYAQQSN
ncbi:MAG TPA: hypothetical protein VMR98_04540 [Candidatus Polarisedimenticolaceae bacterium]|nr:hypothetical protein [Candidatus Polarisedimenticolaceae bacterium]